MLRIILIFSLLLAVLATFAQEFSSKMNGVSFVASSNLTNQNDIVPVKNINANWVTIMPFGFIPKNDSEVKYNQSWQWVGETSKGIAQAIEISKKNNLKVLLKPHIWLHYGWVGDLSFTSEKEYEIFEKSYSAYILDFAELAENLNVEVFCIGVELKKIAVERPSFVLELIKKVRKVYSGKLTYAANWDNYDNIAFWHSLDFIGIDAYFPVSTAKTPSFQSCFIGWKPHYDAIKKLSKSTDKKVIFTEFGYRNIDYTGQEPWTESKNTTYNSIAQINAFRAIFSRFWGENWFAGGFIWKWFPNHSKMGGTKNNRFTPQNKPVEAVIKTFYGKNS